MNTQHNIHNEDTFQSSCLELHSLTDSNLYLYTYYDRIEVAYITMNNVIHSTILYLKVINNHKEKLAILRHRMLRDYMSMGYYVVKEELL